MKALIWHGKNDIRYETVPDPTILKFPTTELNGVFYRTPTPEAVKSWRDQTGKDFVFAWKRHAGFSFGDTRPRGNICSYP